MIMVFNSAADGCAHAALTNTKSILRKNEMKVRITETLSRVVEAESVNEVADKYAASEIVLDADDFVGFSITEEKGEEHGNNADL